MTAIISRAAAEQVQREIRAALGLADLPVLDVMVRNGAWVLKDEIYALPLGQKGVA